MPRRSQRPRDGRDDFPFSNRDIRSMDDAFQRLDRRAQIAILTVVLAVALVGGFIYWYSHRLPVQTAAQHQPPPPAPTANDGARPSGADAAPAFGANMLLGNPSGATADPAQRDNFLMVKPYFCLSYNNSTGTPNWVSWRVTVDDLGEAQRADFHPDDSFPPGFNVIASSEYTGSGFDRGHMCPHSDRAANDVLSRATFVMSNIVPQAPNLNRKAWAQMEIYCRTLVKNHHQRLYVSCGPLGRGGKGEKGFRETIGRGRVVAPSACWKIVVTVPDTGADDLTQFTPTTRVLTVIMPNDNDTVGDAWAHYRTTVTQVEQRTGLHFFDQLPPDVARGLRERVDTQPLPEPKPLTFGKGRSPASGD